MPDDFDSFADWERALASYDRWRLGVDELDSEDCDWTADCDCPVCGSDRLCGAPLREVV